MLMTFVGADQGPLTLNKSREVVLFVYYHVHKTLNVTYQITKSFKQ